MQKDVSITTVCHVRSWFLSLVRLEDVLVMFLRKEVYPGQYQISFFCCSCGSNMSILVAEFPAFRRKTRFQNCKLKEELLKNTRQFQCLTLRRMVSWSFLFPQTPIVANSKWKQPRNSLSQLVGRNTGGLCKACFKSRNPCSWTLSHFTLVGILSLC